MGAAAMAFEAMGTVVSLRLGAPARTDGAGPDAATDAVRSAFTRWEARCSLFLHDSELSRVARGELGLPEAGDEVRDAYAIALRWRDATGGSFTPHRGDGVIDLDGVVKALAAEEAGRALDEAGRTGWAIGAGGDVLVGGGGELAVGIVDPLDRGAMLARVDLDGDRRRAVATSGSAERGDHIWTVAGLAATPFAQVSVAARDLLTADVLATAIVSGGFDALDAIAARFDVDVLAVTREGGLLATPGWPRRRTAPA
ncbi:FAD:protein FMN transferase [Agromyces arachidis]|uniref:FAD:protein FMN transferase n=1 Tax=Agromyces arachidis TaxID=766966 RepID=UPI004055D355